MAGVSGPRTGPGGFAPPPTRVAGPAADRVSLSAPAGRPRSTRPDMDARTPPADRAARLFRRFGWPRAHLALFAALCAGFAATPAVYAARHGHPNKDYRLWYEVGESVREGQPLYPDDPRNEFPYMYPPTAAVFLFAPLAALGPVGFVLALAAVNAACWLAALFLSAKVIAGRLDCHPL